MPANASGKSSKKSPCLRLQLALRCSVVMLVAGGLAAIALLAGLAWHRQGQAQTGQQAIAQSIAQTLSNQTARAVRLGVPLNKLPGVEAYLEQTLDQTPQLAYLAIADVRGQPMYTASSGAAEPLQTVPITVKGQSVALVQVGARTAPTQGLLAPTLACMVLVVLGSAFTGGLVYLWPARRLQRQHDLLQTALDGRHNLPPPNGEPRDALHESLQTLAHLQHRNQRTQQDVQDYAAELRAVDFDHKMRTALDSIAPPTLHHGASS